MTNLAYERLHENLAKLKLNTVGTILDNYLEIAAKEGKTARSRRQTAWCSFLLAKIK